MQFIKFSCRTTNTTPNAESCSSQNKNNRISNDDHDDDNIYDAETDVESDDDSKHRRLTRDYESIDLEVLSDFLSNKKIYLGADLSKKVSDMLERYITAFKGYVSNLTSGMLIPFMSEMFVYFRELESDIEATDYIISEDIRYKEVCNLSLIHISEPTRPY